LVSVFFSFFCAPFIKALARGIRFTYLAAAQNEVDIPTPTQTLSLLPVASRIESLSIVE
jgi:hypothetical protein